MPDTVAVPAHLLPGRTAPQLLDRARQGLAEAEQTEAPGLRYATAHLAALRAAAAILAARATPTRDRRQQPPSVWVLLPQVTPELAEWATFFANTSSRRAAAEAGIPHTVTDQDANNMLAATQTFTALAETHIGGPRHA